MTTTDLIDAAAWSAVRGSLLFHLDLAQILAIEALPPGVAADAWAIDVGDQGYVVTVLSQDLARETFAVTFAADGAPIVEPRDRRASPRDIALATARRTVLEGLDDARGWTVVALPPPPTPGAPIEVYRLGGEPAVRLTLDADGRRVLAAAPVAPPEVPTEAHVHASLKHDGPLELSTPANGARWRVAAGQITRL